MSTKQTSSPIKSRLLILSIETSCDETAIAVVAVADKVPSILANQISSQVKLHAKWGGVVPNLAAREHVKNIDQLLELALSEAQILPADIDVISVTEGPGLIPALLVGVSYAKTLSYLWEKPLLGIHHIEGHIYANFVGDTDTKLRKECESTNKILNPRGIKKNSPSKVENCKLKIENSETTFPVLALVVSGGHTQLVLMKNHLAYEIIGQTVDDAVGEAFDKVARILGIGYPGGPAVAAWAAKHKAWSMGHGTKIQISHKQISNEKNSSLRECNHSKQSRAVLSAESLTPPWTDCNDKKENKLKASEVKQLMPNKLVFPRPMLSKQNFNFSFSGLKTAVLYEVKKFVAANGSSTPTKGVELPKEYIAQVCHEFQQACIDVLVGKTLRAAEKYQPKTILLAGGVSANTELREQLGQAIEKNISHVSYCVPELGLTGDNAAMIGAVAAFRWQKMSAAQKARTFSSWKTLEPNANLKMQKTQ